MPRVYKRIRAARELFEVYLIYWDRAKTADFPVEAGEGVQSVKLRVRAPEGKTFRRVGPLAIFGIGCLRKLFQIQPDLIHAANLDMLLVARLYQLCRPATGIVYEAADLPKFRGLMALEKQLAGHVSRLILTSVDHYQAYYREVFPREKVLVIPNCPEGKVFESFPKTAGVPGLTVGLIGSIRYYEQILMLVEAAGAVDGVRLLIAGAGPDYERVRAAVSGLAFVEFYGPFDYSREIAGLYARVDCLYSVYNADLANVRAAMPNRLYEGIHCELPLIAARGTSLGRFVAGHRIGFEVDHRNPGELAALLAELRADPGKLAQAGLNCRQLKDQYRAENYQAQLFNLYQTLIRGSTTPSGSGGSDPERDRITKGKSHG